MLTYLVSASRSIVTLKKSTSDFTSAGEPRKDGGGESFSFASWFLVARLRLWHEVVTANPIRHYRCAISSNSSGHKFVSNARGGGPNSGSCCMLSETDSRKRL